MPETAHRGNRIEKCGNVLLPTRLECCDPICDRSLMQVQADLLTPSRFEFAQSRLRLGELALILLRTGDFRFKRPRDLDRVGIHQNLLPTGGFEPVEALL
ncbi:MAG: hypothetical protein ACRD4Q_01520 [Candidatus Acidiferrales bacterium]